MSHGLTETDKGIYKGAVWHSDMTDSTIVDSAMTAEEARAVAFDWDPILVKTYCRAQGINVGNLLNSIMRAPDPAQALALLETAISGAFTEVPGTFQVVRNDKLTTDPARFISTGRGVGRKFRMIDNRQITEMMDALTNSGAAVVSAFSLYGGQRVVMVAQLGKDADVEQDAMRLYLVMTAAHDGTAALRILITPTRVVCWNTLSFAMENFTQSVSIQHRRNAVERLAAAEELIATCSESFGAQVDILRKLARVKMTEQRARDALDTIIVGDSKQADNNRARIMDLYMGAQIGYGRATKNTAFGMLSALGQYTEMDMTLRAHKDALDVARPETELRAQSVLFGAGAKLRQHGLNQLLPLLN